jgi:hypothetical protein
MSDLSAIRFSKQNTYSIIPVIVKYCDLPEPVENIQHYDISKVLTCGRNYFKTQDYRRKIFKIGQRIEELIIMLSKNNVKADCSNFQPPNKSAFFNYKFKKQEPPFRN